MLSPLFSLALLLHIDIALAEICGATGAIGDGDLLCTLALIADRAGSTLLPPLLLTSATRPPQRLE
jgi:hypothetical protein